MILPDVLPHGFAVRVTCCSFSSQHTTSLNWLQHFSRRINHRLDPQQPTDPVAELARQRAADVAALSLLLRDAVSLLAELREQQQQEQERQAYLAALPQVETGHRAIEPRAIGAKFAGRDYFTQKVERERALKFARWNQAAAAFVHKADMASGIGEALSQGMQQVLQLKSRKPAATFSTSSRLPQPSRREQLPAPVKNTPQEQHRQQLTFEQKRRQQREQQQKARQAERQLRQQRKARKAQLTAYALLHAHPFLFLLAIIRFTVFV